MKGKGPIIGALIFIILIGYLCIWIPMTVVKLTGKAAYEVNTNPVQQVQPDNPNQSVPFVEPRGIDLERDQQAADINKTNSEAYKNLADGAGGLAVDYAQATLQAAQACDIRNDCHSPIPTTSQAGLTLLGYTVGASAVILCFFLLATKRR